MSNKNNIRNFSIIAHIDHGKSTLADRILEKTNTVTKREMKEQMLDSMDLERERGITIKLNFVNLKYKAKDGEIYSFNLIDTPGHVDFSYEVSRSLAACEGALLVVDATQGIEAQTLANTYLAIDNDLVIIPVINKIDLPFANPLKVRESIKDILGIDASDCALISAKTGQNIEEVLENIVKFIPAPEDLDDTKPFKALIFDSYYDRYRGVILSVRIFEGNIKVGDQIKLMSNDAKYSVMELGIKTPHENKRNVLSAGEVGYIAAGIREIQNVNVGDTVTNYENPTLCALPGYKKLNPMVFCGLYSIDSAKYTDLKDALEKIKLSDSSLTYEPESSKALGFGFRCGFLGLLHLEVIQERLQREYNLELIATAPSVIYKIHLTNGNQIQIDNPTKFPAVQTIKEIYEPFVEIIIMTPEDYIGSLMELCQNKRGIYKELQIVDERRRKLVYEMPLNEIIFNFFDRLKSISKGYASFDYELIGYVASKLVRLDFLLNGVIVDAFSLIVNKQFAPNRARVLCLKLKDLIPRQNFEISVQAAINKKIIARENIKAVRKNVTAKLYGGDVTRKKKLLEKQKEGKKRLKMVGSVSVPQDAFLAVLKIDEK